MTTAELLDSGRLEAVSEIAKRITGQRPSPASVWRWCRRGLAGGTVKLSYAVYRGCLSTTETAFREFIAAQTAARDARCDSPPEVTDEQLAAAGLL